MIPTSPTPSVKAYRRAVSLSCLEGKSFKGAICERPLQDLHFCDDGIRRPEMPIVERHELDKAKDDFFSSGELAESFDLIIIHSSHQNAIHFYFRKNHILGDMNTVHDS